MKRYQYQQFAGVKVQSKQRRTPWIMTGVATVAMLFSASEVQLHTQTVVASQRALSSKDKHSEIKEATGQYRITNVKGMAMLVPVMSGSQQTIASIAGYTPTLPDGSALKLLTTGDLSRGYQLPMLPADTQILDVHYRANQQSANVDLLDCDGQPVANVDGALGYTIDGRTAEKIDFSTVTRRVTGYRIVQDETLPKAYYDGNHSQTFRIFYAKFSPVITEQTVTTDKTKKLTQDTVRLNSKLEVATSELTPKTNQSDKTTRMARYGHQDDETEVQRSNQGWFATLISVVLGWFGFGRRRKMTGE